MHIPLTQRSQRTPSKCLKVNSLRTWRSLRGYAYLPWAKIHSEPFSTRMEARKREKYLKSYRGRELIRKQFVP